MKLKVECRQCGQRFHAPEALAGRKVSCPNCRAVIDIPAGYAALVEPKHDSHPESSGSSGPLLRPKPKHDEDLIDMTAMVDIVFFLLIFFLVTSTQSLEAVLNLPGQAPSAAPGRAQKVVEAVNSAEFVTIVIDEDDTVWIEDEQIIGEQNLRFKLRSLREENEETDGILIIGSAEASHGTLVMVIDAGADAGMNQTRISVREQVTVGAGAG